MKPNWILTPPTTPSTDALSVTVRSLLKERAELQEQLWQHRHRVNPMTPDDVRDATERLGAIKAELKNLLPHQAN